MTEQVAVEAVSLPMSVQELLGTLKEKWGYTLQLEFLTKRAKTLTRKEREERSEVTEQLQALFASMAEDGVVPSVPEVQKLWKQSKELGAAIKKIEADNDVGRKARSPFNAAVKTLIGDEREKLTEIVGEIKPAKKINPKLLQRIADERKAAARKK